MYNYEINDDTLAIIPIDEYKSKVIEKTKVFIVEQTPMKIIDKSCKYFGSSYQGRFLGTKSLIGVSHKAPIIVEETKDIHSIKNIIKNSMESIDNLDVAAKALSKFKGFAVFGLGVNFALSLEAALKIKETSYINTSVYPMGEFVHGHFALLNETKAFLTFITHDASEYELKTLNKILKTYKSRSIVVSDVYDDYECDILVKFQQSHSRIATIVNMIIVVQLLALKIAKKLHRNIDKPIGLVKVVKNKG